MYIQNVYTFIYYIYIIIIYKCIYKCIYKQMYIVRVKTELIGRM